MSNNEYSQNDDHAQIREEEELEEYDGEGLMLLLLESLHSPVLARIIGEQILDGNPPKKYILFIREYIPELTQKAEEVYIRNYQSTPYS